MKKMFPDDPGDDDDEPDNLPPGGGFVSFELCSPGEREEIREIRMDQRRMPWPADYFGVQPEHVFARKTGVLTTRVTLPRAAEAE